MTSTLEQNGLIRLSRLCFNWEVPTTEILCLQPIVSQGIFGDQDIPLALALPGGKQPANKAPPEPSPKGRHAGFGRSLAQ